MTSQSSTPQVSPEVARYLEGPPPETSQFAFLIGEWTVEATKYTEGGVPSFNYLASWSANWLNEGRMLMDDFKALGPDGKPVSSFVTLRTYCELTKRWEMVGLQALNPSIASQWHGECRDGEMHLNATATLPGGSQVQSRIRFYEVAPDSFSWESFVSLDQGTTWGKTASLRARRKS